MKTTRRELNKINCRKRILKASRKLFSSKGYEETMIEDIAQRAEVSKATVYNYFPSKESLLIGTVDEVYERIFLMLEKDLVDCANSEEKLKAIFAAFIHASLEYPGISRRIAFLNASEESTLYDSRYRMTQLFEELIRQAQKEGIFRPDANPEEVVDMIMGIYFVALFQWRDLQDYTVAELEAKVLKAFHTVLHRYYA